MELTPLSGMSAHLLQLLQLACSLLLIIPQSKANCYTSEIKVSALQDTKHIELSINVDKEIASLEESIRQLDQEIVIDPAQSPKFIAVLCLAAKDLSEIAQVPPEKTLYAAYILPKTSFILLAHETGSRVTSILQNTL